MLKMRNDLSRQKEIQRDSQCIVIRNIFDLLSVKEHFLKDLSVATGVSHEFLFVMTQ